MRKNYTLLLLLFVLFQVKASVLAPDPNAFITTWKTNNAGSSNSTSITIPTTGGGYNYDVDWNNDGVYDEFGFTGNATHDYGTVGTYQVAIRGSFPRIYFNGGGDKLKILSINQWGSINWQSMEAAFSGCDYLNGIAVDVPNLTAVTNMVSMFNEARSFNQNIGSWDVSNVTNMQRMFYKAFAFNQNIGAWNVSNVTDMSYMFAMATYFNQNIGNWDVSNVTNMRGMFMSIGFDQNIGNWNVGNVTDMSDMFNLATSFKQNISTWNISKVTNLSRMFYSASRFNQSLASWGTKLNSNVLLAYMLDYSGLSVENYDAILTGFNAGTLTGRSLGAGAMRYCISAADRANLIKPIAAGGKGWTISRDAANGGCQSEIDIKGNGVSIANGDMTPIITDHTDFGGVNVTSGSVTRIFTIGNTSAGVLNLTGTPLVIISGTNAADLQ